MKRRKSGKKKRQRKRKTVAPDDITVEVWKCLGEMAVEFLTKTKTQRF